MKKFEYTLIGASLIFSFIAIVLCTRPTFPVEFDLLSFMEVFTGLMGLCAAFIVGWQIFSSMHVREEIKTLSSINIEFNNKLTELNTTIANQFAAFTSKTQELEKLIGEQKEHIKNEANERCAMTTVFEEKIDAIKELIETQKDIINAEKNERENIVTVLKTKIEQFDTITSELREMVEIEREVRKTTIKDIESLINIAEGAGLFYNYYFGAYYHLLKAINLDASPEYNNNESCLINLKTCISNAEKDTKELEAIVGSGKVIPQYLLSRLNIEDTKLENEYSPINNLKTHPSFQSIENQLNELETQREKLFARISECLNTNESGKNIEISPPIENEE